MQGRSFASSLGLMGLTVLTALVGLVRGSDFAFASEPSSRPNIVLIQVDDLSMKVFRGRIRERGADRPALRIINRQLMRKGTTFSRFYSNNPICAPSRASLLTGLTTHNHRMLINASPFGYDVWQGSDREKENLATWLSSAGYRTAHVGKFLNGYGEESAIPPGWDNWVTSIPNSGAPYYGYHLSLNGDLIGPIGSWASRDPKDCRVLKPTEPRACKHSVDVHTAFAVDEIEQAGRENAPFFLQVDFNAPHDDGQGRKGPEPPTRYRDLIRKAVVPPLTDDGKGNRTKPFFIRKIGPMSRKLRTQTRLRVRKEIVVMRAVDDSVGRIVSALRETGQLGRTHVVFTSDNGLFAGEHRIAGGKYLPYEPATRQPLLIRGPGIASGLETNTLASTIDLAPTIMELAASESRVPVDGWSLASVARATTGFATRAIPLEGFNGKEIDYFTDGGGKNRPNQALVVNYTGFVAGRWKYIRYRFGAQELYDLRSDPKERRNLTRDSSYRKVLAWAGKLTDEMQGCSGERCRPRVNIPRVGSG